MGNEERRGSAGSMAVYQIWYRFTDKPVSPTGFFCAYRFSLTLNLKFKFQPILMSFGERTGFEPVLIFETFQGVHLPPRPARPLQRRWRAISNCEIEASNNVRM
jgi:hypothetical protein